MAKKYVTKSHISDINGDLIAPDTEIEASLLGDAATIKRYQELDAIEDAKEGVIVTGDETEEARKKAEAEAAGKANADTEAAAKAEAERKAAEDKAKAEAAAKNK